MNAIELQIPALNEVQEQIRQIALKLSANPKQEKNPKWITNAEACKSLGVTPRTLQNYRDKGIISFSKVGSKIYYKQSDLEDHLESHYFAKFNKGRRGE